MTDKDKGSPAWKITPSEYIASRERNFGIPKDPFSVYVPMRDGCRLAVDVYLPQGVSGPVQGGKFPTILIFTPYYRRFKLSEPGAEPTPNAGKYRDAFVPYGYAVVVIDVRGTGASFGMRDSMRSPKERDDSYEIAEWAVGQPWCDGNLGATGISYLGAAACFLASTGHPAVKAIAPLFAVSDIYSEQLYPGGLLSKIWMTAYDELMIALDHDRRDLLPNFPYFADPRYAGPQPVDEDVDGALVKQAVAMHRQNFKLADLGREFFYRDAAAAHDPGLTTKACSPYGYVDGIKPDVAILSVSGWVDGAGYVNGSVTRFLTLPNKNQWMLFGPWDHGARANSSPWRSVPLPEFALMGEVTRFFDRFLMNRANGYEAEARVHYFSPHGETWHASNTWPPNKGEWTLHADVDAALGESVAKERGEIGYQVDFTTTTGKQTRYERLGTANIQEYYPDWKALSAGMLHFDTAPLKAPVGVAGHVLARLCVASSEADAAIFVYLSEVEASGEVRYISEGMLRLLHRKVGEAPRDYTTAWPYRSFDRADAQLMTPGKAESVAIAMLPTAWTLAAGSRLRISVSGADAQHYPQVPHGRPPRLTFVTGGSDGTSFVIPVRED
ncbi:MAG: CocE/NonD family hydrolase [Betaproteobacteria bacterium]